MSDQGVTPVTPEEEGGGILPPRTQATEGTFQALAKGVEHLNESVIGHTAEVQMLRAEVAEMQTRAELIESRAQLIANQMRLDRVRGKADRRRFLSLFVVMVVALVALTIVGLSNRHYNQVLVNCTTPGHECYERGQKTTAAVVGKIVDADSNGVADSTEIKARLDGQPPPTAPATTTTIPRQVITTKQEIGWQFTAFLALIGIAVMALIAVQLRPEMFRRKPPKANHRASDPSVDDDALDTLDWWPSSPPAKPDPPAPPAT